MKKAYTIRKMDNDYLPFKVWWGECHICGAIQIYNTFEQMVNYLDTHGRRWHTPVRLELEHFYFGTARS